MGIYIVAMTALFFLAFAYFAVGQAAVTRNSAQTAADAAALAAAREARDEVRGDFLAALTAGDVHRLADLLGGQGMDDDAAACAAAADYANLNHADFDAADGPACHRVADPPGYTVDVITRGTVGDSVIDGTENKHARATATAVVEPRCTIGGKDPDAVRFACPDGELTIDPTAGGFMLDLSAFYSVHLST